MLDVTPSEFLAALYEPGEHVCLIDVFDHKMDAIWTYGDQATH